MDVNIFDDCRLATTPLVYFNKIRCVLEDNFNINTNFNCSFEEKHNYIMVLDITTGELTFQERVAGDINIFTSKKVIAVHYFLQIATWMIYNTLIDQRKNLISVFNNFYDYMFGPIMTSIIFYMNPTSNYISDLPSLYIDNMFILTIFVYPS